MALDGILFYKIKEELRFLETGRINKIQEASENEFLFTIRRNKENFKLLISLSANYPRVHITNESYSFPLEPKSFTMLLRKHFEGATINLISTHETDRILEIHCSKYNEMGDLENKKIIVEIMGRYSNLVIVENNIVKEAFRHLGVFEKRVLVPNAVYEYPDTLGKINPFSLTKDEFFDLLKDKSSPKEYCDTLLGLSMFVAGYAFDSPDPALKLYEIINSNCPTLIKLKNKNDFTYFNVVDSTKFESFSSLLDYYYSDLSLNERIKAKTNNIESFIDKQIKKLTDKKNKLLIDQRDSTVADKYRLFGELLIANNYIKTHQNKIEVLNYYTNEMVTIPLDQKYDLMGNSKLYFKKYNKAKNSIFHINEQLAKVEDELEYFTLLKGQLKVANLKDVMEIQAELVENKYLIVHGKQERMQKPKVTTFVLPSGILVNVGKNNVQNEMVTHKLSLPQELWFHVKDAPGSHVVLKKCDDYTEQDIRICANIAACFSSLKDSSSVPVNYTKVKNIKKIPGKKNCFVSIRNEKTIYIDPDMDSIKNLTGKK